MVPNVGWNVQAQNKIVMAAISSPDGQNKLLRLRSFREK
jgi:hypothetical protein